MLKSIMHGLGKRDSKTIGVCLGADHIAVVQAEGNPPAAASEVLLPGCKPKSSIASGNVVVCLPQPMVVTKILRVPSTQPEEIRQMAQLQACRQMPLTPDEIVMDYELLHSDSQGYSDVLMAVARREDVERFKDRLEKAGVAPRRLILKSQAVWLALRKSRGALRACLFAHIDSDSTTIGIVDNGRLVSGRGYEAGPGQRSPEHLKEKLLKELSATVLAHQKASPRWNPEQIVLAGDAALLGGLGKPLEEKLHASVVIVAVNDVLPGRHGGKDSTLLPAYGASLEGEAAGMNLMPRGDQFRDAQKARKKEAVVFAVMSVLIMAVAGGIILQKVHIVNARTEALDRVLAVLAPQAGDVRRMLFEIQAIREQRALKGSAADVLRIFNRHMPARIALNSLNFEKGKHVIINGAAFTLSEAVNMVNVLEKSGQFEKVEMRSSSARQWKGRDMVDFQVYCQTGERRD